MGDAACIYSYIEINLDYIDQLEVGNVCGMEPMSKQANVKLRQDFISLDQTDLNK